MTNLLVTCDQIERVAESHGWSGLYTRESSRNWKMASTGSLYCELSRCRDVIDEDGDEIQECQSVTIRVSDHPTVYCSERFSIVVGDAGGDDHSLAALATFLASEFCAD